MFGTVTYAMDWWLVAQIAAAVGAVALICAAVWGRR